MSDFKAYFFVNPLGPPTAADYQHCIIAFAEGLKDLGIPFGANINYYKIQIQKSRCSPRCDFLFFPKQA